MVARQERKWVDIETETRRDAYDCIEVPDIVCINHVKGMVR